LDRGWADRYSDTYLARHLLPNVIADLRSEPTIERARGLLDAMVAEYESFSDRQIVWYPIENLRLSVGRVSIGDMTLFELDDDAIEDAGRRLSHVLAGSLNDEKTNEAMMRIYRERWGDDLRGDPIAEIPVIARKEIAEERARERYDEVVDLLNAAATLLTHWNARVRVGAPGEVGKGLERLWSYPSRPRRFPCRRPTSAPGTGST
jgi:hypothetical protein